MPQDQITPIIDKSGLKKPADIPTLLVIDMQQAWLNGTTERFEKTAVIHRINQTADFIRAQQGQVIFIRHVAEDAALGSEGWQLHADLVVKPQDSFVDKTACDSFADTNLLSQLQHLKSTRVYICGLATEFCVDTTLRAALSAGFDVVALADAHTTGDRPHLTAAQIVGHHNWVWQNLAAPAGRCVQVMSVSMLVGNGGLPSTSHTLRSVEDPQ